MVAPAATPGRLVLVPNSLDLATESAPLASVLPQAVIERAASLHHWVVETPKVARAFLGRVHALSPLASPLQTLDIQALPRASKGTAVADAPSTADWEALLGPARAGHDIGLLSDAGLPAVADPGAALVAAAHRLGIGVEVLAGGSSLALALAASGLNGQRFAFEGYLPQDPHERALRMQQLTARSAQEGQTQIVIETPYRNNTLLEALLQGLPTDTRLSVAWGLTCPGGGCRTQTIQQWRAALQAARQQDPSPALLPDRLPAVFLWLAAGRPGPGSGFGTGKLAKPAVATGAQRTGPGHASGRTRR